MAILYSYPLSVPQRTDLIIGTRLASSDTDDLPITQNYSIGALIDMVATTTGAQTFNAVANVGAGVAGGNETVNLITFKDIYVKEAYKDSAGLSGNANQILSSTGTKTLWIDQAALGVTAVTGTAPIVSSGGNTPAISLANTAVTAGIYTNTNLTVDAQGRITAAASGTGGYTLPAATAGALGGIKIGYTDNVKNYAVQLDTDNEAFVNVPWTDTDTDTGALSISTAVNSTGTWTTPLAAGTIDGSRNIALTSNVYGGGTKVGFVPTGGTGSLYLKGDGTWASIPTGLQFQGTWDASATGGGNPDLTLVGNQGDGFLRITSVAGTAYPNGGTAEPSTWNLGDWAVYVGAAGSGTWTRVPATNAGVTSFVADSTNSSYLTMTPTTASTGAVELDADLSATAVSGNIDNTKFLRGDNKWAVPSYTTDTNTTYSVASGNTTIVTLTGSDSATSTVTLAASGAASVSGSSNTITIDATDTNTTYDFLAIETIPTFTLNIPTTNTGYTTAVNLATTVAPAGGTGMTVDITASSGNVTAVVINKPGSGYAVGDVVTIVQTGSSGDATITLSGSTGNVNPNLRLIDQAFSFDDVKLTGGNNMTITRTADTGISFVATNTQNEYATSWVDSSNDVLLRLTESGAGSGTQDLKIVAGTNIALTPSGANMTIDATNTTYTAGNGLTLTGTVFSAKVDVTQADDDTVALSAVADRFYGVQLDNATDIADAKLVVNIPWTDTMGSGFTVSAGTDTATTTITAGDTLILAQGTNVTTVSDPDGTITINSTDQYEGTVTSVSSDTGFVYDRSADPIEIGNWMTIGLSTASTTPAFTFTTAAAANASHYVNGNGDYITFPTIPGGTITSVGVDTGGNAYSSTPTQAAPTSTGAVNIAIAPQGDATQYINGAGDLTTLDDLADVTGRGASTTTASTFSGGLTASPATNNTPAINTNSAIGSIISLGRNALPTNGNRLGKFEFNGYSNGGGNPITSATISASANIDWVNGNNYDSEILFQTTVDTALRTALTSKPGLLNVWGDGSSVDGQIKLNCWNNNHGQTLSAQPHSEAITNTMLLPKGANSTLVSEVSTSTLTNKSGSNSQWTNDEGYITSYTETDTLATVTGRGASTSTACTFSSNTTFGGNIALSSGKFITWNSGALISTSIGLNSIQFNASNGTNSSTSFFSSDVDGSLVMEVENAGISFLLDSDGNLGLGTGGSLPAYKLDVNGTIRATGDVIAYSDVRVKENIKTIDNSLEKVSKLRGVEFNKIGNNEKSIGVIAQEIEDVIPEVVKTDNQGMKSVAYGNISGLLIEAIKELKQEIEELKKHNCNCKE